MSMGVTRIRYLKVLLASLILFGTCRTQAEESVEFVAEHLLEVPMDARALAFPITPADIQSAETRLQLGYGSNDAGKLHNTVPMFGAQYFLPLNKTWGLIAGAFYDRYQFSGKTGNAIGQVLVANVPQLPGKFNLAITDVSGSGNYGGASFALTYTPESLWRWQFGVAQSNLNIKKFKVDFYTIDLNNNFRGSFDYASHYHINSFFVRAAITPRHLIDNFTYSPHVIIVHNAPRIGFQGRVIGPDFDYSGNTETNNNGKHIPDDYLGIGVNFEHQASGIRMDLGALLYTYALEPSAHEGIKAPIFVTISAPIF